ncbi:hypothetical protein [Actinoplanes sp. L3-i22]|uniref:hypothetical protein n=1 Tax=Actinoplanes sp. L3-i22 TaxID=2836373 RepID=UPI001C73EE42|nr:hypothetical protein [Actinoplanes sp. L3-i22]BCY11615.1 hypothetical protein L3i22_067030 [Actinoplanes sp. L3-i22]
MVVREVKEALARMTGGAAGPSMAEMARDLLAGRIRLRDLATSSVYADPMAEGVERYLRWAAELTPEQSAALEDQVRDRFGVNLEDRPRADSGRTAGCESS